MTHEQQSTVYLFFAVAALAVAFALRDTFALWPVLFFLVGLSFLIAAASHSFAADRNRRARYERWWPRYAQDLRKTDFAMTDEQLHAYAEHHGAQVIAQYRKRSAGDPYWSRSETQLDGDYGLWLQEFNPEHAEKIRSWYREPVALFNLAMAIKATKTAAELHKLWDLEHELIPELERDRFFKEHGGESTQALLDQRVNPPLLKGDSE